MSEAAGGQGKIRTREQLVAALQEAAEIEHQLMIQYLYAAFSLKKRPDERCSAAQLESVRRWGSTLLMVARQEMEHLALVNGLLSAVAAYPYFARENIPRQSRYYLGESMAAFKAPGGKVTPCDIPFVFERFNLATISRFVCLESPGYDTLEKNGDPMPTWCFGTPGQPCGKAVTHGGEGEAVHAAAPRGEGGEDEAARGRHPLSRSHLDALAGAALPQSSGAAAAGSREAAGGAPASVSIDSLRPGTIQELYDRIQQAVREIPGLFANPGPQVFVPIEYQINIFPITDADSASVALELIVEEGEGIDAPPDFQSHFRRFFEIRRELAALLASDPAFEPSLPLPFNPRREDISNPFALRVFDLFNFTYVTLLFLLTSLYRNFQPAASQTSYPYFSSALQETAFGPMMTMLVRPLAEVLALTRSGDGDHSTGPDYHLSARDEATIVSYDKAKLDDIDFFEKRFAHIVRELGDLADPANPAAPANDDRELLAVARNAGDVPYLRGQLHYVYESATAIRNNMRRIYQIGQLPQFVVPSS